MSYTSSTLELQAAIVELLSMPGALRVAVPVIARKRGELMNKVVAAAANHNLCLYVFEPLPTRAMRDVPFVFFEEAEVRVSIFEKPAINSTGADVFDLLDDVCTTLHWAPKTDGTALGEILAYPLQLASRPIERSEDETKRVYDVIFTAVFQLNRDEPPVPASSSSSSSSSSGA